LALLVQLAIGRRVGDPRLAQNSPAQILPAAQVRDRLRTQRPDQSYWNLEHIAPEKKAYEWVKEKKEMFIDLRWKTELPGKVQQAILEDRGVNDYLGKIRLKYVENGLTRMDSSRQQAPRNPS
jgi:hypothetical protein